jgi:DNA invertase Pin-like site-specific DNA recombinase
MFFHIMGALAPFERDLIRERTLAGLTAARAQGRFGGRPKALSPADLETARAAIAAGEDMHVARRVGVSRQTLYAAGLRKHPLMPVKPPRDQTTDIEAFSHHRACGLRPFGYSLRIQR